VSAVPLDTRDAPARGRRPRRPLSPGAPFKQALMLAMAIAAIYPVYYMVATSLKTRATWTADQFGLPLTPTTDNYAAVFEDGRIPIWFMNSVIVTGASVAVATVLSTLAAYAIARLKFRGRTFLLRLMVALMVIPPAVLILPLFLGLQPLGLTNTYQGVVLVYAGMLVPISVYMLASFFRTLPVELFDAARIDGASTMRILRSIVLPLSAPGFVTLVVVNALWVWNELLIALVFLQDDQKRTLMAGLTLFKGHFSINEPLVMAGTFLAALPMLLLFLFGQRYFVRGLVAGAVK
jgi:ABC-type glycerol-3-phosphate transport system permease component